MNDEKQIQVHKGQMEHPVTLRDAMNRLFDESFWHPFGSFFSDPFAGSHAIDLSETEKEVKVKIDIPGYDPSKIKVDIEDNILTISGEKSEEREEKDERFYRKERSSGHFSRCISLPKYIDADGAKCTANNGSLEIVIPKMETSKKKSIKINVE